MASRPKFIDCSISDNIASDSEDIFATVDEDFFNQHIFILSSSYYGYSGYSYYSSDGTGFGGGAYYGADSVVDFNNCVISDNHNRGLEYEYSEVWNWPLELYDPNDPNDSNDMDYYEFIMQLYETNYELLVELYETYGSPYDYTSYYRYGDGAGLYSTANNQVSLIGCAFVNNRIGDEQNQTNIYSYSYSYYNGSGNGGAVYCGDNSNITIDDCVFRGNNNGIWDENYYAGYGYYGGFGGAIYCGDHSTLSMNASLLTRNEAVDSGGGIYLSPNCFALINDTISIGNEARQSGGMLHCDTGNEVDIINSAFVNNNAVLGSGGAIYLYETDADINNCPINNNTARRGGGLYWAASDPRIFGCTISGNIATGNREAGGGFYCVGSSPTIEQCVITENSAQDGYGGGGSMAGLNRKPIIKNCLITKNYAGYDGAGLVVDLGCKPIISNCTFAENSALGSGGGLYCRNNGEATDIDSIIWGNIAENGTAQIGLSDSSGGLATVSYSDVQGGYTGTDNIDNDPCFVGDYYLSQSPEQSQTSPCVNAGSGVASDPNIGMDQYTTRTDNGVDSGQVDMGYHHRPNYYRLIVSVDGRFGLVAPLMGSYSEGTGVTITAAPERGYKVERWNGTNNDAATSNTSIVTIDSDRTVTVEFEFAAFNTYNVPGNFDDLQSAIDAAQDGDLIILNKGIWPWGGFYIAEKVIMITSTNPDSPEVVAQTVIDCNELYAHASIESGGFFFGQRSGSSVLNGITISGARGGYSGYGYYGGYLGYDYDDSQYSYGGGGWGGGAIHISPRTSPVIANCIISGAYIHGGNGGTWDYDVPAGYNGLEGWNGGSAYGGGIYV